jgi:hypothetical protein
MGIQWMVRWWVMVHFGQLPPIVLAAFLDERDPMGPVCGIQRLLLNPKGDKSAIWCRIMAAALSALPCFEVLPWGGRPWQPKWDGSPSAGTEKHGRAKRATINEQAIVFHSSEQIFIHLFLSSSTEKNSSEHEPYTFCKNSFTL